MPRDCSSFTLRSRRSPRSAALYLGSSEESVGELRLWKLAKDVIQGEFGHAEGPVAVGFSHSDFDFVVQSLDDAAGELLLGTEVVQQQFSVGAHRSSEFLQRLDA